MSESSANSATTLRVRADGTAVQVMPDGTEVPYAVPEPDDAALDAMTDEDIARQVAENPDAAPLLSDEELDRAFFGARVRRLRNRLGLSQARFAERFHIPVASLQEWEQGRRTPDAATQAYIRVIEREPDAVLRALRAAE